MKQAIDLVLGEPDPNVNNGNEISSLKERLHNAFRDAREKQKLIHARQKKYYDENENQITYNIGDKVWLSNEVKNFTSVNWFGPYEITEILGSKTYRISPIIRNGVKLGTAKEATTISHDRL